MRIIKKIKPNGSVVGKNRNAHKKTSHTQKKNSNAKKRMTAEEFNKSKRLIEIKLRNLRGKRNFSEVELD